VLGASDETGEQVGTRPVHPRELHSTIYELMGIDPAGPLPNQKGLEVRVADDTGGRTNRLSELV
jgi:hypothetical protein